MAVDHVRLFNTWLDTGETLETDRMAGLFTADAVFEFPFAPEGFPRRLEGRDAIAAFLRQFPKYYRRVRFLDRQVTPLADGSGVVAEYRGEWETVKERPYNNTYVAVVRFRDGQVSHIREFFNPLIWIESVKPAKKPA
jgi:uncharacterized protein